MNKFFIIVASFFCCACYRDVSLDFPQASTQLVASCLYQDGQPWTVYVSTTRSIADTSICCIDSTAVVKIWSAGMQVDVARPIGNGFYRTDSVARQGRPYVLKVEVAGFSQLVAQDTLPVAVKPDSSVWYYASDLAYLYFTDPLTIKNYYQFPFLGGGGSYDPILEGDFNLGVASDAAISGKNYTYQYLKKRAKGIDTIRFKYYSYFNSLSYNYFKYVISLHSHQATLNPYWLDFSSTAAPTNLFSNIQGGLGIFAGYSVDSVKMKIIK